MITVLPLLLRVLTHAQQIYFGWRVSLSSGVAFFDPCIPGSVELWWKGLDGDCLGVVYPPGLSISTWIINCGRTPNLAVLPGKACVYVSVYVAMRARLVYFGQFLLPLTAFFISLCLLFIMVMWVFSGEIEAAVGTM